MDVHDRFMKFKTAGTEILENLANNCDETSYLIQDLALAYNKKAFENAHDLQNLETIRTFMNFEYQTLMYSRKNPSPLECRGYSDVDFTRFLTANNDCLTTDAFVVLHDIVVLQSIIYPNRESLIESFNKLSEHRELFVTPEMRDLSMRVAKCFADCYNLHNYIYKSIPSPGELEEQCDRIVTIIQRWMNEGLNLEWKLLASLLPKVVVAFGAEKIVCPLWQRVIGSPNNVPRLEERDAVELICLEGKLSALCVMADFCFPSATGSVQRFHYEQCVQREFWSLIDRGIVSLHPQQRKQALFLIKRAMEFADNTHESQSNDRNPYEGVGTIPRTLDRSAMPFVCYRWDNQEYSLEEMKQTFILILQALEEEQERFVLPYVTRLSRLTGASEGREFCSLGLSPTWLRCMYKRILQHENPSVKLFGLREIFESDSRLFNDSTFIFWVIVGLNDDSLYETNSVDVEEPEIAKQLQQCLLRWEQDKRALINAFVRTIGTITWTAVPIYWVLIALLGVSQQCEIVVNKWQTYELQSVEKLIRRSLSTHPLKMRVCSHALIVNIFQQYAEMPADPSNFDRIFNITSLYAKTEDRVHAVSLEAKRVVDWSNLIKPSDAQRYVTRICEKNLTMDQSLESFADMIGLMAAKRLIMIDEDCPAKKALRDLLENLIDADSRPNVDDDLISKVLELTGHLINPLTVRQKRVRKLLKLAIPYGHEIVKIVNRNLMTNSTQSLDKYLRAMEGIVCSPEKPEFVPLKKTLKEVEEKTLYVISHPRKFTKIQWLNGMEMQTIIATFNWIWHNQKTEMFVPLMLEYFADEVVGNEKIDEVVRMNEGTRENFGSDCSKAVSLLMGGCPIWIDVEWLREVGFRVLMILAQIIDRDIIVNVSSTLNHLLEFCSSFTVQDLETVNVITKTAWRTGRQLKTAAGSTIDLQIIQMIINDRFLELEGAKEFANECVEQMMQDEEDDDEPSSKQTLLWAMERLKPKNKLLFHKVFMFCLIHDAAPRRDEKILSATMYHYQRFGIHRYLDLPHGRNTRAHAVDYLDKMIFSPDSGKIREVLLNDLLSILKENRSKVYSENSDLHMLKNRVMQALLMMITTLDNAQSRRLYDALCDLLIAETNQPSVRLMHEWLLIKLCSMNDTMRANLWSLFETATDKRSDSIVSLACIVFHLAKHYSGEKQKREYIAKAIPRLLEKSMDRRYNVSLYSQTVLVGIYKMLLQYSPQANIFRNIFNAVEGSLRRDEKLMEDCERILNDFYFEIFDPLLDHNTEAIYHDIPRLTNVPINEWISREVFNALLKSCFSKLASSGSRKELIMAKPQVKSSILQTDETLERSVCDE